MELLKHGSMLNMNGLVNGLTVNGVMKGLIMKGLMMTSYLQQKTRLTNQHHGILSLFKQLMCLFDRIGRNRI